MRSANQRLGLFFIVQALGLGTAAPSAMADLPSGTLLQNGSFEQPVISGPSQLFSAIPGWSPTAHCSANGDDIKIEQSTIGGAADGNQYVELNSACVNGISQMVATSPGASYSLTLAFAARPITTVQENRIRIRFDGQVVDDLAQTPTKGGPSGPSISTTSPRPARTRRSSSRGLTPTPPTARAVPAAARARSCRSRMVCRAPCSSSPRRAS